MSEPAGTTEGGPVQAVGETNGQPVAPSAPDGDTFPREYVEELRSENAANRVKAGKADQAMDLLYQATLELATAGLLYNPKDLPPGEYLNDEGLPDVEKMRTAALALVEERPYLARVRGSVSQGPVGQVDQGPSLGAMLRAAAR